MSAAHDPDQLDALLDSEGASGCHRCRELARLAYFDQLTGLANRFTFNTRLDRALARARRQESRFAVLFLDLDDFKVVNDTLGHDMGDVLLQRVADRLRESLREYDTVARYGGDEFAVLLEDMSTSPDVVADRLISEFEHPFELGDTPVAVTVSVGVATFPEEQTAASLIRKADTGMYSCKAGHHEQRDSLLKVGT